jgi:hypothetical protein
MAGGEGFELISKWRQSFVEITSPAQPSLFSGFHHHFLVMTFPCWHDQWFFSQKNAICYVLFENVLRNATDRKP